MIDELERLRAQKRALKARLKEAKRRRKKRQDPQCLRLRDPWSEED